MNTTTLLTEHIYRKGDVVPDWLLATKPANVARFDREVAIRIVARVGGGMRASFHVEWSHVFNVNFDRACVADGILARLIRDDGPFRCYVAETFTFTPRGIG